MKNATLALLIVATLAACGRDSSSPATAIDSGTHAGGFTSSVATPAMSAPAVSMDKSAANGAVSRDASAAAAPPPQLDPMQFTGAATASAPAMVIRIGQAFIEVEKVDVAVLKVRQLSAHVGGYITNSSITGGRDEIRQAAIELKIPAQKYDEAVGALSTIGKVETVTSTSQDVGEEFVDITARVNNSRRLEERLLTLLGSRTGKLDEVLRVERELARVREEIERYEGRLRYLSSRVAMSTLTITVHEPAPILGNTPGENPIATALRRAWRNFIALVAAVIASLGVVIPLALVAFGGWAAYRRTKRG